MSRQLVLRPAAERDLRQIYDYIAEASGSDTAIRYIRRLRTSLDRLLTLPEVGRRRDDLRPGLRLHSFERRIITAYLILPSGDVEVGRFFYGGRDVEALLTGTDEGEDC